MELTPAEHEKLAQLRNKFAHTGQDMVSYLEGLLHSRYLTYWDYLHIDTLLSLQTPRTDFPDELVFICYHQITELYFKLILTELDQICLPAQPVTLDEALMRLGRINAYFKNLTQSFDVMVGGMDPKQFLQFRMALLPASGFQSAQFRLIELRLTDVDNLVHDKAREAVKLQPSREVHYNYCLENLYWKFGNLELKSGHKTLTLRMFEEKYDALFRRTVLDNIDTNLLAWLRRRPIAERTDARLVQALRTLDVGVNVFWKLSHYKSAVRYLQKDPEDIKATGGTNWQQYLPPRFQRVVFYPNLWSAEERTEWGKGWVLELFKEKVESGWSV